MGMQFPGTLTGCCLLKFRFLSGSTGKSVFPLVNVSLIYLLVFTCPGGSALPPALPRAPQTRAVNLNLEQNIQCLVLAVHADKLWLYPEALQRCSEITWVSSVRSGGAHGLWKC